MPSSSPISRAASAALSVSRPVLPIMEAAPNSAGRPTVFTLMPIPSTRRGSPFSSKLCSVNMPQSFPPSSRRSLGHFISGSASVQAFTGPPDRHGGQRGYGQALLRGAARQKQHGQIQAPGRGRKAPTQAAPAPSLPPGYEYRSFRCSLPGHFLERAVGGFKAAFVYYGRLSARKQKFHALSPPAERRAPPPPASRRRQCRSFHLSASVPVPGDRGTCLPPPGR